jgi:hypothetical protein
LSSVTADNHQKQAVIRSIPEIPEIQGSTGYEFFGEKR